VGTSRTERHIDPHVFNEATQHKAFNAGVGGLQTYRLAELTKTVVAKSSQLERIFIEVTTPTISMRADYKSNPLLYVQRWKNLGINISHVIKSDMSLSEKSLHALDYTRSFLYKYIGTGASKHVRLIVKDALFEAAPVSVRAAGWRDEESLTETLGLLDRDGQPQPSRDYFLSRLSRGVNLAVNRGVFYRDVYFNTSMRSKDLYVVALERLAQEIQQNGIEVYFVVPPRMPEREAYGIKKAAYFLEQSGFDVISLVDIDEYPQFYFEEDYHSDQGHLSRAGARAYTAALVEQYLSLTAEYK